MLKNISFKFLFVLIILISLDYVAGIIFTKLYINAKSGVSFQEYSIINRTNQEVLILGSSRAAFHYIPEVLSDSLKLSVYNAGREGTGIYFHNAVLEATLKRYNPKLIILDLDYRDIYKSNHPGFEKEVLSELAPFVGKISPEFDSLVEINWYDRYFYKSNMLRYNKKVFRLIKGNLFSARDDIMGFRPLFDTVKERKDTLLSNNPGIDIDKLKEIEYFINRTLANNIKLVIIVSPYFSYTSPNVLEDVNKLCKKSNTLFLNHISDTTFEKNPSLFNDITHLNKGGAEIFSRKIAHELKEYVILK
jgi:hypothetical protein